MGGEPDILIGHHVLNEFFEHNNTASVADNFRMHGEDEDRTLFVGLVELGRPDGEDI